MASVGDLVVFGATDREFCRGPKTTLLRPQTEGASISMFDIDGLFLVVGRSTESDFTDCVVIRDASGALGIVHSMRLDVISTASGR